MRMNENMVRLGLIGIGEVMQLRHVPSLEAERRVSVVALADIDADRARRTARRFNADWTQDWSQLVSRNDVDAVLIATPHHLHADVAVAAAEAGKHVLCEKPMASTVADCDRMIAAAEKAGVRLMIAENYLYEPSLQQMKQFIEQGMIGDPTLARFMQAGMGPGGGPWRYQAVSGGGCLLDPGVHMASLARYFLGPVNEVSARTFIEQTERHGVKAEVEDHAEVIVRHTSGRTSLLSTNWLSHVTHNRYEVVGTEGWALFEVASGYQHARLQIISSQLPAPGMLGIPVPPQHSSPDSYSNELHAFLGAIAGRASDLYSGREGKADLEIVEAAMQSAKEDGAFVAVG